MKTVQLAYLGVAATLLAAGRAAAAADPALLLKAAQVRALGPAQAGAGVPVKLSGVVTYAEPQAGLAFLQDDTAGVMLCSDSASFRNLKPGLAAEVSGVTVKRGFAPAVLVAGESGLRVLGAAPFPKPRRLAIEELQRGVYDGLRIELRGVVRLADVRPFDGTPPSPGSEPAQPYYRLLLEINTAQGRYTALVPWEADHGPPAGLTDSAVRLEGVLGSIVNARGQWVGLLIYVPDLAGITVERPPAGDPFLVAQRSVGELLTFSADKPAEERVRVRGTLLVDAPGYAAYLRTPEGTIELHGSFPKALKRGDYVEASGYPTLLNKRVFLDDCLARLISGGAPVEPVRTTVARSLESDLHGELVQIQGELLQNTRRLGDLLLILNCEGQSVEATMPLSVLREETGWVGRLTPGSRLELTGVAQVLISMQPSGYVRPHEFRLLLGGPRDIRLLRAPPWWTVQRLLGLVGALLAALGLVAIWVALLRRQVRLQTEVIKEKVEREAVWRDRSRIAQDIHDDLGASLTQVGFLIQRIKAALPGSGDSTTLAERIADLSRSTVRALDEIVWAVNPRHDSLQSLADYLVKLSGEQLALARINCRLDIPPVLPAVGLRADVRHNLVLAVKEALHNAMKHSRAQTLRLALHYEANRLEVIVQDDGVGFAPAKDNGHRNGLANISRRLAEIGGECRLETAPGQGTCLRLLASLPPLKGTPAF